MEDVCTLIIVSQNKAKLKIERESTCLLSQFSLRPVWYIREEIAEVRSRRSLVGDPKDITPPPRRQQEEEMVQELAFRILSCVLYFDKLRQMVEVTVFSPHS